MCPAAPKCDKPAADSHRQELLRTLEIGPCHRFSDWPDPSVPKVAAGVYTIWDHDRFIYVGMPVAGWWPRTSTPQTSRSRQKDF
jgi:hypothetical protein